MGVTRMIDGSLSGAFSAEALAGPAEAMKPKDLQTNHGPLCQQRRAWGPVAIIAPWNVPSGTVLPKVIAALVAGCPVIVKPSEWAPTGLGMFLKAINSAGLPAGALQYLHGGADVGAALVND